jgi:hypothetical protein
VFCIAQTHEILTMTTPSMRCCPGPLIALVFAIPSLAFAAKVYYSDQPTGSPGSIISVGLDGTGLTTVVTYPGTPNLRGIAWHRASGRIYILDNGAKMIRSIFPNGSSQMDVASVDPTLLGSDLEVDDSAGKIFWSETRTGSASNGFIRSANLDGTNVATAVAAGTGSESPYFIFVDRPAGFIYWAYWRISTDKTYQRRFNEVRSLESLIPRLPLLPSLARVILRSIRRPRLSIGRTGNPALSFDVRFPVGSMRS